MLKGARTCLLYLVKISAVDITKAKIIMGNDTGNIVAINPEGELSEIDDGLPL